MKRKVVPRFPLCLLACGFLLAALGALDVASAAGPGTCKTKAHQKKQGGTWKHDRISCVGTCVKDQHGSDGACLAVCIGTYYDQQGHRHEQWTCVCVYPKQGGGLYYVLKGGPGGTMYCDVVEDRDTTAGTKSASCMGSCPEPDDCEQSNKQPPEYWTPEGAEGAPEGAERSSECDCL